jgi:preprotein translocase subunit SecA
MDRLGMEDGQPIEHPLVSRAIENAQGKVEARNFEIRKHLLEYDDVMNKQREVIYDQRNRILRGENLSEDLTEMIEEKVEELVDRYTDSDLPPAEWDYRGFQEEVYNLFAFRLPLSRQEQEEMSQESLRDLALGKTTELYEQKKVEYGDTVFQHLQTFCSLQAIDLLWKEHLLNLDHLKEGIGLRGYGQKNPLYEYQKEGFAMFEGLVQRIKEETLTRLFRIRLVAEPAFVQVPSFTPSQLTLSHGDEPLKAKTVRRDGKKVGRNDSCPCGSGKKYKKCCGR